MEKMILALKSRTFWTICAMFFIGGVNQILPMVPPEFAALLQGLLGLLAVYFKLSPSQKY